MKKLLIFMLVLGLASLANATVVQLETDGVGSISSKDGSGVGQELVVGDRIKLKVTLTDLDNYSAYPQYDGYVLSTLGITLESDADGDMFHYTGVATKPKSTNVLTVFGYLLTSGDLDLNGASTANDMEGYCAGTGNPIIWNIYFDVGTADGSTTINMVLDTGAGSSWYKELLTGELDDYTLMGESDLGDLILTTVPEPTTVALLGLGGMFLLRRRKS